MIAFILFSIGALSPSDRATARDTVYQLDPIVVVGTREPARLSRCVNSAIVLSPSRLAASTEDNVLANLGNNDASISISSVKSVGYGLGTIGQGQLFIRGLGFSPNNGTLVLIDGRPDIAGLFGHPLPDTYERAGLYSADLIKGGASTLYGSNAIAGVLDLTSFYRPDLDRFTKAELWGGTFKSLDGSLQHSQKFGRAIIAGWYDYVQSDNQGINNQFLSRAGGFRTQLDTLAGWTLFLSGKYSDFFFADPGPDYQPLRTTGNIARSGVTFGADRPRRNWSLSARLYSSYGDHHFSDGFNSVDRNSGADLFARWRIPGEEWLTISGGASADYIGGSAYNGTPFVLTGNFGDYEYAGMLQAEAHVDTAVTLIAGGRMISNDRYSRHAVYQLGAIISPERIGSLKLSVASAYRNPTVMESQLFLISNPDSLRPEEGTFYEIGYYNRIAPSLSFNGAVFWRDGKNLIESVPNSVPPPPVTFVNTGTFHHSGWEASATYVQGGFRLTPSFSHLNQKDFLISTPEDKFALSAALTQSFWSASLESISALKTHSDSTRADGSVQEEVLKDYTVINADLRVHVTRKASLLLRLENLFDTKYQIVFGYPMPGFTVRGGLSFQI